MAIPCIGYFNICCVGLNFAPFVVHALAQKRHGRRSNLYTDYTFAVKNGDKLVSFSKAYSGLTDKEFTQVDAFVKRNSIEKFGPVRTVKPELVFEIALEGIAASNRQKAAWHCVSQG